MSRPYLLLESQSPFDHKDCENFCQLALDLQAQGEKVLYVLLENGVFSARKSTQSYLLERLLAAGVDVKADQFSLQERGISAQVMVAGVGISDASLLVDCLADQHKAIWH